MYFPEYFEDSPFKTDNLLNDKKHLHDQWFNQTHIFWCSQDLGSKIDEHLVTL